MPPPGLVAEDTSPGTPPPTTLIGSSRYTTVFSTTLNKVKPKTISVEISQARAVAIWRCYHVTEPGSEDDETHW